MSDRIEARVVRQSDLELFPGRVINEGGELRLLSGSDYGLVTSIMVSQVAPGSGPRRHRHPHAEIFVLHEGQGRFEVEGTYLHAQAGDVVIIPPDAWHSLTNSGTAPLRHVAIHENQRAVSEFEDGSRRE
jgi:quercetin dioxygenase-like cupin family protein